MIAHVLLAGIDEGLVIPAGPLALLQGRRDEAPPPLAGQYLAVQARQIPALANLGLEAGEQLGVIGAGGQVLALQRIVLQIEQQRRVQVVRGGLSWGAAGDPQPRVRGVWPCLAVGPALSLLARGVVSL